MPKYHTTVTATALITAAVFAFSGSGDNHDSVSLHGVELDDDGYWAADATLHTEQGDDSYFISMPDWYPGGVEVTEA